MLLNTLSRRASAALLLSSALVACGDDETLVEPTGRTITETAVATPQLSTLVAALETADLAVALEGTGPFTVFAPVNDAFDGLPAGVVNSLLEAGNRESLQTLLRYHVVPGLFTASQLRDGDELITLTGERLAVAVSNGVVTVDGVPVITADVEASNGVVHLIDGVLTEALDIVTIASLTPDLSTLVGAVQAAGLVTALGGDNLTVFAPLNSAFAALGDAVPTDPAVLAQVLQLHVVGARAPSSALSNGQDVASLLGPNLRVGISANGITITGPNNTVNVVVTDVNGSNGVIHVIDGVLLP